MKIIKIITYSIPSVILAYLLKDTQNVLCMYGEETQTGENVEEIKKPKPETKPQPKDQRVPGHIPNIHELVKLLNGIENDEKVKEKIMNVENSLKAQKANVIILPYEPLNMPKEEALVMPEIIMEQADIGASKDKEETTPIIVQHIEELKIKKEEINEKFEAITLTVQKITNIVPKSMKVHVLDVVDAYIWLIGKVKPISLNIGMIASVGFAIYYWIKKIK